MSKYKEIAAQTKQNITEAFWDIYCEKRIEKITVKEITARAGYNRGTFYEYFTDVYDVLEQLENFLLPSVAELPPLLPQENASVPFDSFIKLYENSSKYYTVLLGDNGDPAFAAKIKNGIKATIIAGLNDEDASDIEIDYALEYVLSATISILNYWFKSGENMPKEQLTSLMYNLMNSEGFMKIASKLKI